MLSGRVSRFSITFILFISPDSTRNSVGGVLRDRRQSKSEFVFKVFQLVRCIPMIITSSLFMRFERMSSDWKVEKVN
jgi:hypothetical protein